MNSAYENAAGIQFGFPSTVRIVTEWKAPLSPTPNSTGNIFDAALHFAALTQKAVIADGICQSAQNICPAHEQPRRAILGRPFPHQLYMRVAENGKWGPVIEYLP
jgi:hypothetical protein